MLNRAEKFFIGLGILFGYYILGVCILKFVHIMLPPAILGLVLFAISLSLGIIKAEWVSTTCEFFLKNMAILFVPFLGGLIVYQSVLMRHWLEIMAIVFITTTLVIVCTGLFVEYGIRWVKKDND